MSVSADDWDAVASAAGLATPENAAVSAGGLHDRVLGELGLAICSGDMAPGSVVRTEELEARYGVSRSVVREILRVLSSLGMVASRRRIGVQVRPASEWNLYDPLVIRWRLASPGRIAQLRSLTELRAAIEPEAARLAAVRAPLASASELMALAGKLWETGRSGDEEAFLRTDIEFHRLVLAASGNEMFAQLTSLVSEVLSGRTHYGLMPRYPHDEALQMHVDIASAIQRGMPDEARASMLNVMHRAMSEMSTIWDDLAHHGGDGMPGATPSATSPAAQ
jgi:DNA-binding FadR family transcriptional regulator